MNLTFEWDEEKAEENLRKHKVSFDDAKTIFNDPLSRNRLFFKWADIGCILYGTQGEYTHHKLSQGYKNGKEGI